MTYKQAAQQALRIQDACNLTGVVHAFDKATTAVFEESQRLGRGSEWRNTHPIMTMHLLKMCELNGCGSTLDPSYEKAEKRCKEIARDGVSTDDLRAELTESDLERARR